MAIPRFAGLCYFSAKAIIALTQRSGMDLTRIIRELRAELGERLEIIRTVEKLAYGKPVTKRPTHTRKSKE